MFEMLTQWPRIPLMGTLPGKLARSAQKIRERTAAQHRAWPGLVVGRMVDHLLERGSFTEALTGLPGFTPRRSVEGVACLRNEAHLCGAMLTPQAAALQFAVSDAQTFASSTLSRVLQARFGTLPAWRGTAAGVEMVLPLAPGMVLVLRAADAPVDPLFIGRQMPGLCVDLSLHLTD